MASAEEYAQWIVNNADKKGTPEFQTVAKAYEEAKAEETISAGGTESVLATEPSASLGAKLGQSAIKGAAGFVDLAAGFPENLKRGYQYFTTDGMPTPRTSTPVTTYLANKGVITPEREFTSPIGKVAGFTTELATSGGIRPSSLYKAGNLLRTDFPKALKEVGSDVGRTSLQGVAGGSTQQVLQSIGVDSPIANFLATGGAMTIAGAPTAIRQTAGDIANKGFQGISPEQIRQADDLLKRSYQQGSPLTAAEALAQVTGGNPLIATQRFVENAPKSAPTMADFLRQRPQSNVEFMEKTLSGVSQKPTLDTTARISSAAEKVISGAEQNVTKNIEPYYTKAGTQTIAKSDLTGVMTDPVINEAVKVVRSTGKYGVKNFAENDPRTLIAAKQYLDDQYSVLSNPVTGAEKNAVRINVASTNKLDNFLRDQLPDYDVGANKYQTAYRTQISPLKQSQVGELAETGAGEKAMKAQQNILMPSNPQVTKPEDIKRTVDLLRRKDPTVVQDWTPQSLQGFFNETSQKLQGGENQFGGAKFASNIAGNKQQRENLKTLIIESAGIQAWNGFEKMLETMEAQGKRQPMNSATSFNNMIAEEFKSGGAGKLVTSGVKPSIIANAYDEFRMGKNAQLLAKLLTDPDGINKLKEISNTKPNSAKAQVLTNSLVGGYISQKESPFEENK